MGTNRRFCRLWFVLPVPLWVVACSSEPDFNPGAGAGGRVSSSTSSKSSNAPSSSTNGTTASSGGSKNSSGGATSEDTAKPSSSNGGTTEENGSEASSKGGSKNGSSTKRRTSIGGSENSSANPSSGGNSVNWGEGGSRFVASNVAGAGPTCTNEEKDEGESDVDCGGICAPNTRCEVGKACVTARDCYTTSCVGAKCADPLVIIKNAGCVSQTTKCPTIAQDMRVRIQMMNVSGAPLDIKGMEIRYYFTNEAAVAPETTTPETSTPPESSATPEGSAVPESSATPETPAVPTETPVAPGAEARVDDNSFSTIKGGAYTVSIVKMKTATATADHYISIKITGGTIAADLNRVCDRSAAATDCAELEMNIHTVNYAKGTFDPSNDYSFVPASGYVNNGNITVHKGDDILWGTPPA